MNKWKEKINSKNITYIVVFFVMLLITCFKCTDYADDAWFADFANQTGIARLSWFIEKRYETWSSRVIIETILILFVRDFPVLWKISEAFVYVLLTYGICKVFINKERMTSELKWIIASLVICLPQVLLSGAGWVATSINYLWPISFCIISLIPIKKVLSEEKIRWFEYIIYIPSLLFACNAELICIILFTVYLIFTIYFIYTKSVKKSIIIMFGLSIVSLIFIMTCPGNKARTMIEIGNHYKNYEMLNIFDKLSISFSTLLNYFIYYFNLAYVLFTLLLLIKIYRKYQNLFYRILAVIPFIMGVAFNIFSIFTQQIVPDLAEVIGNFNVTHILLNFENFDDIRTYIPLFLVIFTVGDLFILLYLAFGNTKKTIIAILVLGAGICSKLAMGFVVTAFESGYRTIIPLIVSFVCLSAMLLEEENREFQRKVLNILCIITIFTILNDVHLSLRIGK